MQRSGICGVKKKRKYNILINKIDRYNRINDRLRNTTKKMNKINKENISKPNV